MQDANLKHTLQFGIGLHHAGLDERDRKMVERLFVEQKIQVRHRPSHCTLSITLYRFEARQGYRINQYYFFGKPGGGERERGAFRAIFHTGLVIELYRTELRSHHVVSSELVHVLV